MHVTNPHLLRVLRESAKLRQPEREAPPLPEREPEAPETIEPESDAVTTTLGSVSADAPPANAHVRFMNLFEEFRQPSWNTWRHILSRIVPETRQLWIVAGRGCGKSRVTSDLIADFASRTYHRAPGETIYCGIGAPDRKQSRLTLDYARGLLQSVPELSSLIVGETKDSIVLSHGVTVETITGNMKAPRGRKYSIFCVEECAFFEADTARELIRSVLPALARQPGSLLVVISSPYRKDGPLYEAARKFAGQPDGRVVFVQAPTLALNGTFDRVAIEEALADDPSAARSEYLAVFRDDIESYATREAIDRCIVVGRRELPRIDGVKYSIFADPAGGGSANSDSFTIAGAHQEKRNGRMVTVLDFVAERRPPFSPSDAVAEFAAIAKGYGVTKITSDRWAGGFSTEQFRLSGVHVTPSEKSKSDVYVDFLSLLNSGNLELLDHPRLIAQLVGLERRTGRSGRDTVDHMPGAHDDLINSAAGACMLAALSGQKARPGVF